MVFGNSGPVRSIRSWQEAPSIVRSLATLLTSVVVAGAGQSAAGAEVSSGSSFVDRFSSLDRNRWMISNGWSNGSHQGCTWTDQNVRVGDGRVTLSLTDQPNGERPYSCAEIRTKGGFGYGTYEVRMRSAAAPGIVTAFFTYVGTPFGKGLPHDEIDFEFLGKNKKSVQLNYYANGNGKHEKIVAFDFDTSTTTNNYAFEWMPESLRWFTNGRLVHEAKGKPGELLPTYPGRIFLSIWSGQGRNMEGWLGRFSYPGQPISASFEYVAFTKAGEPCQFPTSVVCTMGTRTDLPE